MERCLESARVLCPAALTGLAARLRAHLWLMAGAVRADGTVSAALRESARRLFEAHHSSILRLAYSYLRSQSDAEEVLQDTLLQYLKTAPALESPEHEKAWLLHVAANLSKNRLRYNRVRRTDELDESLAAGQREDLAFVWDAVKTLPVPCREAVHLYYYEGYSTAQIAALLGKKESTVRSCLMRGRQKLKETLKEAYDFE